VHHEHIKSLLAKDNRIGFHGWCCSHSKGKGMVSKVPRSAM
jgi:hypothetical protein